MPADFIIDVTHGVVLTTGTGEFTRADFIEHMSRLKADPNFNPDFNQVVDCRAITLLNLNGDEVRDLASQSIFSVRSRRAFVASSDLQFGLGRMFAAYREMAGQQMMVFKDMQEALACPRNPPIK